MLNWNEFHHTVPCIDSLKNSDIQFIGNLYTNKRVVSNGNLNEKDGFGNTTIRLKYSFAGNKNEKYGLAIIPFVKLPTNQNNLANDNIESGIGVPFLVNSVTSFFHET